MSAGGRGSVWVKPIVVVSSPVNNNNDNNDNRQKNNKKGEDNKDCNEDNSNKDNKEKTKKDGGDDDDDDDLDEQLNALQKTMSHHLALLEGSTEEGRVVVEALPPPVVVAPLRSLSELKREGTKLNGPSMPNRKDKVTVYVRIVFLKVGEIDTLRDRFSADAFVQSKWREPALDGKLRQTGENMNWELYWNPKLKIDNVFGDPKDTIWYSVTFDRSGLATVCEKRRVSGTFIEFMELNQFPFDSQDLSVTLGTDRTENEIEFVKEPKEACSLSVQSFVDEQEWKLHKFVRTWLSVREEAFKNVKSVHPAFSAACKASRRPQFFIWNIFVVMFLICSLSFATFSVSFQLPQNRLQLSFILLLTTVSFKFVVNQSLPMISYLTYLDKYILGSMAILCTICIWHALIPFVYSQYCYMDIVWKIDIIAFAVLGIIYILFHIGLVAVLVNISRVHSHMQGDEITDEPIGGDEDFEEGGGNGGNGAMADPYVTHQLDSKAVRANKIADQTTSQQAALSAWQ